MNKLLDTTIFVDYLRGDNSAKVLLDKLLVIKCSIITAAELIQGARNKKEQKEAENLLSAIEILSLSSRIGDKMIGLMKKYSISYGLQIPDAMIAASAITNKLILLTGNIKHFRFIKELKVEDWNEFITTGRASSSKTPGWR